MGVRRWLVGLTAVADRPVHVRVSGLLARETVSVASQAADAQGARWRGEATFAADGDGVFDLDRSAPVSGSYGGTDAAARSDGWPKVLAFLAA